MNLLERGVPSASTKRISIPLILSLVLALHQLLEGRAVGTHAGKSLCIGSFSATVCIVAWRLRCVCSLHKSVQRCFWGWGECLKCLRTRSVLGQGAENSLDSGELFSHQIMASPRNYKKLQACNSHLKWCIEQVNCFQCKLGSWTDYHMGFS